MPEEEKQKPSEKEVDIDTSGPAVEVDVAEPKDESVVETKETEKEPEIKEEEPTETVREIKKEHFISYNYKTGVPDIYIDYEPKESLSKLSIENWKKGQESLKYFWYIGSTEYLQALRARHTSQMKSVKGETVREPLIGKL